MPTPLARSYADLFVPYALPYLAYVGIAALPEAWLGRESNYALRLIATVAALCWVWRSYPRLTGPRSVAGSVALGCAAGLLGLALWIALLDPWSEGATAEPWPTGAWALRALAATTVVPLFEEVLMRGYVFRFALAFDHARRLGAADAFGAAAHEHSPSDIAAGGWSVLAVFASSAVFALGHHATEYPAALVYGVLMCLLWIRRGDLVAPIAAHATTNAALALYVRQTGAWTYW